MSKSTLRLALSYLAVILVMSIGFSVVLFYTSAEQIRRQAPPPDLIEMRGSAKGLGRQDNRELNAFFAARIQEGRQALLRRLVMLNLGVLAVGGALSYYLARRTLRPIEASIEAQELFISDASHELRTPLTAMQTMNEVALRRKQLTPSGAREIIQQNIVELARLRALSDGLLNLAGTDAADMAKVPVSLQDVAGDGMNRIIALAQDKRISVEDSVGAISVVANRQGLEQIVVILLDNAIKYSPSGSTIYMTSEKKAKSALLHVRDSGPGIRPYDLRKIFERFYRADQSRSRQIVEGHGIGLSIARKIARQHGGDVTAESTEGVGSTFTLKLPLAG